MDEIFQTIIRDVQVNLSDEFDRNFENKSFFDRPWSPAKLTNNRGSLMMRTGNLRNSINSNIQGKSIVWTSSLPYASIHNEGGEIVVTQKMKSFFWAMYYKAAGAVKGNSQRDLKLNKEAEQWKALALMTIGKKIKIEQRQFIGEHPNIEKHIEFAMEASTEELNQLMINHLRQK